MLLVLLHDFPEFLCDYHFSFCDVIPPNCIQMRNLILSAFPRNMRLPDPFTPNLKVTSLGNCALQTNHRAYWNNTCELADCFRFPVMSPFFTLSEILVHRQEFLLILSLWLYEHRLICWLTSLIRHVSWQTLPLLSSLRTSKRWNRLGSLPDLISDRT